MGRAIAAAWPLGASLAAAAAARGLSAGRRRAALNEAVHELRRPLQALALAVPPSTSGDGSVAEGSLQMAASALERLEREINGGPMASAHLPVAIDPLLTAAAARWRPRATIGGGSLELGRVPTAAVALGDRVRLAEAVDNLLANAIEHGGPEVEVAATISGRRLRIAISDRGRRRRAPSTGALPAGRRRGQGLRIVRRTAKEHGGRFRLVRSDLGVEASIELPLLERPGPVP